MKAALNLYNFIYWQIPLNFRSLDKQNSVKIKEWSAKKLTAKQVQHDIQASSSLNESSGTLDEITTRYVSALNNLVDKHAPLLQRTITVRPHARWYNEQLRDAKHVRRQLEQKWRHSKTESDHEAYRKQCSIVAKELYTAKTEFYSNIIIDNQGKDLAKDGFI